MMATAGATIRLAALPSLLGNPWPTKESETWKYSSAKNFLDRDWKLSDATSDASTLLSATNIAFAKELSAWSSVLLIAGNEYQTCGAQLDGVKICSSAQTAEAATHAHVALLNSGLTQQTITIQVAATDSARLPLAILIPTVDGIAKATRVVIEVGSGAKIEILEWIGSTAGISSGVLNCAFEYRLASGALASVVRLENADSHAAVMTHSQAEIATDAVMQAWQIDVGHAWSRQEWTANLNGVNAHAELYGVMSAGRMRHMDHQTYIHHHVGETTSKQIYKSILHEGSRAVFNGKIVIPKDSQKSNSQMLNKNLLLSRKCEIDAKPELLVSANDVKASHGCTVGQLNEDELFYLATRCIDPEHARVLLAKGFAVDSVYAIPHLEMRKLILRELDQSLAVAGHGVLL